MTKPDIVLMHLGTNDIYSGQSEWTTIVELGLIIDEIREAHVERVLSGSTADHDGPTVVWMGPTDPRWSGHSAATVGGVRTGLACARQEPGGYRGRSPVTRGADAGGRA